MTYLPGSVDPSVRIVSRPTAPAEATAGMLWFDEDAASWKVCTQAGPPAVWAPLAGSGGAAPLEARYVEALDYLPAVETARIVYLTRTVGGGYEADRLYVAVP